MCFGLPICNSVSIPEPIPITFPLSSFFCILCFFHLVWRRTDGEVNRAKRQWQEGPCFMASQKLASLKSMGNKFRAVLRCCWPAGAEAARGSLSTSLARDVDTKSMPTGAEPRRVLWPRPGCRMGLCSSEKKGNRHSHWPLFLQLSIGGKTHFTPLPEFKRVLTR